MMNDEANAAKKGEIIIIFDDDLDGTSGEDSVEFDEILETFMNRIHRCLLLTYRLNCCQK